MNTPKSTPEENNKLTLDMLEASIKESEAFKETDPEKQADDLLEKYPIKFKGEIVEGIKKVALQHKRLVLIIGENTLLSRSIAICIYTLNSTIYDPGWFIFHNMEEKEYVFERSTFKEQSYVGWDNAEIKEHLFKPQETLINRYLNGDTLFLRGIHSKGILERLFDIDGRHGVLIVNVTNANGLPVDLLSRFEVIEIQEKGISVSTPENTNYNWAIDGDKVFSNKQIVELAGIKLKLFKCLHSKKGKYVYNETLKQCWDIKPGYEKFLVDTMNKLEHTLKKKLKQNEKIIESKTKGRKIEAYKLPS